jgi:hypothetical protein
VQFADAYGHDEYERTAYERDAYERNAYRREAYERDASRRKAYERDAYANYRHSEEYTESIIAGARPSGMSKGKAIIYAGVVSAQGIKHHPTRKHGVIEHVASFEGKSMTVAAYEDLTSDIPHVKPNGYKVVFLGDHSSY